MSLTADNLSTVCFFQNNVEDFNCNLAWKYAGIEPPVFAALVPNSADKPLKEVMEEIMGDHEMMVLSYIST